MPFVGNLDYTKWFICLCVLMQLCSRSHCQSEVKYVDEAGQIFGTIFHKYHPGVPPWSNYPEQIPINLYVTPILVHGVDRVTKLMTSTIDIRVKWSDISLTWFIQFVKQLSVSKDRVWYPHICINNAVGKIVDIDSPDLILSRSGEVTMYRRLQVNTVCDIPDTAKEFNCSILVSTVLYNSDVIKFDNTSVLDASAVTMAQGLELINSFTEFNEVAKWDDSTNTTYPVFACSLSIQDTGCCSNGNNGISRHNAGVNGKRNGVISLRPFVLLMAMALVTGVIANF